MNACGEFSELIVTAHIHCCSTEWLQENSIDSMFETIPSCELSSALNTIAEKKTDGDIDMRFPPQPQKNYRSSAQNVDHVLEYVKEVLTLGLFYVEHLDAIKEGDGYRLLQCWKYWLLISSVLDTLSTAMKLLPF